MYTHIQCVSVCVGGWVWVRVRVCARVRVRVRVSVYLSISVSVQGLCRYTLCPQCLSMPASVCVCLCVWTRPLSLCRVRLGMTRFQCLLCVPVSLPVYLSVSALLYRFVSVTMCVCV